MECSPKQEAVAHSRQHPRAIRRRASHRCVLVLKQKVEHLESVCEKLENELVSTRQQLALSRQEARALRCLLRPEELPLGAAEAAQCAAERAAFAEELAQVQERLRLTERERDEVLRRTVEACEAAEYYQSLCAQLETATLEVRASVLGELPRDCASSSTTINSTSGCTHRVAVAAGEVVGDVNVSVSSVGSEGWQDECTTIGFEEEREGFYKRMQRQQQTVETADSSPAMDIPLPSVPPSSQRAELRDDVGHAETVAQQEAKELRRLLSLLRGENQLVTRRVKDLVTLNRTYIAQIAEMEQEKNMVQYRMRYS